MTETPASCPSSGFPRPLGATRLPDGRWNFAVFSQGATGIDLCLFDNRGRGTARKLMLGRTGSVWHTMVEGLEPGQQYTLRAHGPWKPAAGHFFSPNKLLLDPYARAIAGELRHHPSMCHEESLANPEDSGPHVPKCVLVADDFDWGDDAPPRVPMTDMVVYEVHVKGLTKLCPGVPERLRGTYTGLASDAVIEHMLNLGVTTVQLMPVHHRMDDGFLIERGLTNFWGYQSIGFFAPDSRFSSRDISRGEQVQEFKEMVRRLHEAGLEVILDVVYNHTGEGAATGPTVCFRGLDNFAYYRHLLNDPGSYRDFTGCGNTMDLRHPWVLQLVLDSLRYWVQEMHVDGFRFDLAVTLGRESSDFTQASAFFRAVHQDPVLSAVKLIAEPWDLGPGGYQVGAFPEGWAELNGKFRDTMRRFWRGDSGVLPEFAWRLTGSEDLFRGTRRTPGSSLNFITSHDGFTLNDLTSYLHKHNEANGERNRDGDSENHSSNHGVEGPSHDPLVLDRRDRHRRSLLASIFLSRGAPFILAGDEMSRTQLGNNNAYCQDNKLAWVNWKLDRRQKSFLEFTRTLIAFRHRHSALRRDEFFHGSELVQGGPRDLVWIDPSGKEMKEASWKTEVAGHLQAIIEGRILMVFNAGEEPENFVLPEGSWGLTLDTSHETGLDPRWLGRSVEGEVEIPCLSVLVFELLTSGVAIIAAGPEMDSRSERAKRSDPPM